MIACRDGETKRRNLVDSLSITPKKAGWLFFFFTRRRTYPQKHQLCLPHLCWLMQSWSSLSLLLFCCVLPSFPSQSGSWSPPPPKVILMSWHRPCPRDVAPGAAGESSQPGARWAQVKPPTGILNKVRGRDEESSVFHCGLFLITEET